MLTRTDPDRIRLECLEEENRQLRERIAELEGTNLIRQARLTFGMSATEALIFCLMYQGRVLDYGRLIEAVYDVDDDQEDVNGAIRTHIKRLRRRIRPHGVDFKTIYGFGYEMDAKSHAAATRCMGL